MISDDAKDFVRCLRQLLSGGKLDEAERLFESAIEAQPDSARLKSLHYMFYIYLNRAGRTLDAARHAEANVDVWLENLSRSPQMAASFPRQVESVTSTYTKLGKNDAAIQKLDDIVDKVGKLLAQRESAEVAALAVELRASKSLLLAEAGKEEEARAVITRLENLHGPDTREDYWLAIALFEFLAGQPDEALEIMDTVSSREGNPGYHFNDLRKSDVLEVFADAPRYWAVVDRVRLPPLPLSHPFYEKEQRMRFGKAVKTAED